MKPYKLTTQREVRAVIQTTLTVMADSPNEAIRLLREGKHQALNEVCLDIKEEFYNSLTDTSIEFLEMEIKEIL